MKRVLLLLSHEENRRLLAALLSSRYRVAQPDDDDDPLSRPFDLCILDPAALHTMQTWVQALRDAVAPVYLPFLLMTPRRDASIAANQLWESVDELIVSPVEPAELLARVEVLLRARELSLRNVALSEQLEAELARAGQVQATLLPPRPPELDGFEIAARCLPAREVGGDFYDWQRCSSGLVLTVGDVMGKGMSAALLMATVRAVLRALAPHHSPAATLALAREAIGDDLQRSGSFATLFHARLGYENRQLHYVDAGHGHAFLSVRGGQVRLLERGGRPLGVPMNTPYRQGVVRLDPGDVLVLYSDGLVESSNERVEPDELCERLKGSRTAAEMVDRLVASVGEPIDDVTVLVMRCCG